MQHIISDLSIEKPTIHFFHSSDEVLWIFETYKSKAFSFICTFVTNHFGFQKGWIFTKGAYQNFISDVIS